MRDYYFERIHASNQSPKHFRTRRYQIIAKISHPPPTGRLARVPATQPHCDYKGAARELWDIYILGIGLFVCACVAWVINDNDSNTPWRIPQTRRNDLGEKNLGESLEKNF